MSDDKNESIHPRVRFKEGVKKHTNKAKNKDVTKRKVAAIEKHLETHPNDRHSQSHVQMLRGFL